MKIQTINQLVSVFKDIATRHYQINGFGVGDSWEIGADKAYMHPVLWVNPVTANMPSTDTGYKTFEINFDVRVFDLVHKDESNENDVLSDTIDILKDIIVEFKGHPYYVNSQLNIIDDINFEAFTEEFDEEVSGWLCEISLMTPVLTSFCGIPATDISGFEFPDINCPDVNVLCPTFVEDIIGTAPIIVTGGTTKTISIDISSLPDTFVISSILNGTDLELTRNDGVVLTTDLSSLIDDTNTFVTTSVLSGTDLELTRNDGVVLTTDLSTLPDVFVTTSVLNGTDLEVTRNDGVTITTDLSSLAGGGGSVTADNGLNILSSVVELGGTLNKDTEILGDSNSLTFGTNASRLNEFDINGTISDQTYTSAGFDNITTSYVPGSLTHLSTDTTGNLSNTFTFTTTQGRIQTQDTSLNQNGYLDIKSDQVQIYTEDITTGQYGSFDISPNTSNFTHNSGGAISNGVYLSDDNITLTMNDGLLSNAILIDETQITFNGVNPLACETISLQDKTLISDEFVHHAPTTAISDSCLINDSISFHMDGNDLAGRYKNNSGVVTNITFPGGGGGSVTADNGLNISTGGDVEIGGTLNKSTTISGAYNPFQVGTLTSRLTGYNIVSIEGNQKYTDSGYKLEVSDNPGGRYVEFSSPAPTTNSYSLNPAGFKLDIDTTYNSDFELYEYLTVDSGNFEIDRYDGLITFDDNLGNNELNTLTFDSNLNSQVLGDGVDESSFITTKSGLELKKTNSGTFLKESYFSIDDAKLKMFRQDTGQSEEGFFQIYGDFIEYKHTNSNGNEGQMFLGSTNFQMNYETPGNAFGGSITIWPDKVTLSSNSYGFFSIGPDTYFQDIRTTTKGIEYFADYSADYTSLSLITKGDLDGAVASLPTGADNGLSVNSGIVELGGTLTQTTTTILGDSKTFQLGTPASRVQSYVGNFVTHQTNYTFTGFDDITTAYSPGSLSHTANSASGNYSNIVTINPSQLLIQGSDTTLNKSSDFNVHTGTIDAKIEDSVTGQKSEWSITAPLSDFTHTTASGEYNGLYLSDSNLKLKHNDGVNNSGLTIDSSLATMFVFNVSSFSLTNTDAVFEDLRATTKGIEYTSDYSSGYTNRTLVDKEYVDTAISSTSFTADYCRGSKTIGVTTAAYVSSNQTIPITVESENSDSSKFTVVSNGVKVNQDGRYRVNCATSINSNTTMRANPIMSIAVNGVIATDGNGENYQSDEHYARNAGSAKLSSSQLDLILDLNEDDIVTIVMSVGGINAQSGVQILSEGTFLEVCEVVATQNTSGFTGTFTNGDGNTVTVTNGIITNIA